MPNEGLKPVPRVALIQHLLDCLRRYWPNGDAPLASLPVAERPFPEAVGPLRLVAVTLPEWGAQWGLDGVLLVPHEACLDQPNWQAVDWWLAAFLMLECWHERAWEQRHGAIHSYSLRLKGWDRRVWARAWVNRIALFLRAWAALAAGRDATALFGPLPQAEIVITHDVDAVAKTWSIRLKQTAFLGFNALRFLAGGRLREAGQRIGRASRVLFGHDDWWLIGAVQAMERRAGMRSQFNFYADDRPRSLGRWLFDPGYDIAEPRLAGLLGGLTAEGWRVGLHQSHDAWRSAELMRRQRQRLQLFLSRPVTGCRQHWLRFSWRETWAAQSAAGFEQDTTLMFNDRPGFRAATALGWAPWDPAAGSVHRLRALPTILMDSHFYDYLPMSAAERRAAFRYWLDEIVEVGGQGAVLWHPHTLSPDYGWREGFEELIRCLQGTATCSSS